MFFSSGSALIAASTVQPSRLGIITSSVISTGRISRAIRSPVSPSAALATFKQYREADGQVYFKLVGTGDTLLLQSAAFAGGRDAGAWVARFRKEGAAALAGAPVTLAADEAAVRAELDRFLEAE